MRMAKFVDLTGKRFGRLVAQRFVKENGQIKWICACDCGGQAITTGTKLKNGHTSSCGCLQRERTSKACQKDYTGEKYGKLSVIRRISEKGKSVKYECVCDCGNHVIVLGSNLVAGATRSCGCIRKEKTKKLKLSHGKWGTRIYKCWRNMLDRCENEKNKEYKNYGGREIQVCSEWHDFSKFYEWAVANGYKNSLTIERMDVNKGYSPENCIWADLYTQARNRTDNRKISFKGKTQIITDWAKEAGIAEGTIRNRLKRGWTVEDALTKKAHRGLRLVKKDIKRRTTL